MTGWLIALGLAVLLMAALLALARLPRAAWEMTGAALLLGLAGYAWQGNPGLAGSPRVARAASADTFDEKLAEKRRGMADRYGPAAQWLMLSDGLARQGKTEDAANVIVAGIRDRPTDANLWLGLGNALLSHGSGVLSPGADYAYRRAVTLEPDAPAPRYFYGLALAEAGDLKGARVMWASLVAQAPEGSAVRAELQRNVARIDAMLSGNSSRQP